MSNWSQAWDQLAVKADLVAIARWIKAGTIDATDIQSMQLTPNGGEALRLIVRDNVEGQADTIANALWDQLN